MARMNWSVAKLRLSQDTFTAGLLPSRSGLAGLDPNPFCVFQYYLRTQATGCSQVCFG